MKLSTREDIDRPIAEVYDAMADFPSFEDRIRARGVDLRRVGDCVAPEIGAAWEAPVTWRERRYDVAATLVNVEPGECYGVEARIGGVVAMSVVDLVALARGKTRMFVSTELTPTSMSSRLLIQSLKLTKGSLTRRYKSRVAALAEEIRAGR